MSSLSLLVLLALLFLSVATSLGQAGSQTTTPATVAPVNETRNPSASTLLETGGGTRIRTVPANELKILSYNIRWRSGEELEKLIKLFRDDKDIGHATILGLQEVDRRKKRSNYTNTAKQLADELNYYYAWAAPPAPAGAEEETGVAILSAYPLTEVTRIVLPHAGPNHRRRVALGVTIDIGGKKLRFYSVHSETRIALDKKLQQMGAVLQDFARYPQQMPVVVLGDLNTWEADAERKTKNFFTAAGFQTPFGGQTTFSRRILFIPIQIRLDWVWLRGLEAISYGIDKEVNISDHWPLWTNLKWPAPKK